MTRKSILKLTIIAVFSLLLMALGALPIVQKEGFTSKKYLGSGDIQPQKVDDFSNLSAYYYPCALSLLNSEYTLDSSYGAWEIASLFDGNSLYFGLDAPADTLYSALATINTPHLILADNSYTLTLDYFSRRENAFPNFLTIYSSIDGDRFIKLHTETVFFTDNNYKSLSIELPYNTTFIRLEAKVYADDGRTDSGIYIDNFGLLAQNAAPIDAEFSVTMDESPLIYDGSIQIPSYTLDCTDTEAEYFCYSFVSTSSDFSFSSKTDAIVVGDYFLQIAVFGIDNILFTHLALPFTIEKANLVLDITKLMYNVYEDVLIVYNLPLFYENGDSANLQGQVNFTYIVTDGIATYFGETLVKVPTTGEFDLHIIVDESENFKAVTSDTITIGQERFDGLYFMAMSQGAQYNGQQQGLNYLFFAYSGEGSPDFSNEAVFNDLTFVEYEGEDFSIIYTLNDVETMPRNVGNYIATITYKTMTWVIDYQVTPYSILYADYQGQSLAKTYDGSDILYYTRKENVEDTEFVTSAATTLKSHDFYMSEVFAGDDVAFVVESAKYNFTYGNARVMLSGLSLGGVDGGNYDFDNGFYTNLNYATFFISPATLSLAPHLDNSNTLLIKTKTYDGTFDAEIDYDALTSLYGELNLAPINYYGLAGNDSIDITKLSVIFTSKYAGRQEVLLSLSDITLFDRYNASINLNNLITPLKGAINPISLDIDKNLSTINVSNKIYSGNNLADVSFSSCFFDSPLLGDQAILNNTNNYFKITYGSALYSQANAGNNLDITVKNISLSLLDATYSDLINSYYINDLTLKGDIYKKELLVITEHLRINSGTIIPELLVEPLGAAITSSYYYTLSDAENMTNKLSSDPNTNGTYYIRVTCSDSNYYIDGDYKIITLVITSQKVDQIIVFDNLNGFIVDDAITLIKGAKLLPKAYSTNLLGERTNLKITYSVAGSASLFSVTSGIITALNAGTINIIASQAGDAFYNASSTSIAVNIVNYSIDLIDVDTTSSAYIGESLPSLTGNAFVNMASVTSRFSAVDQLVENDKTSYNYKLTFDDTYAGYYVVAYPLIPTYMTLQVAFPTEISRAYYQTTNFLDYVNLTIVRNGVSTKPLLSEYTSFSLSFALSFDELTLSPGAYNLSINSSDNYYINVTTTKNYSIEVVLAETFILAIAKSDIIVKMPAITKYYGQDNIVPSINSVIFEGTYKLSDLDTFKSSLTFILTADKCSPVGSYIIMTSFDFGSSGLEDFYNLEIINSYVVVLPTPITITTSSPSSTYNKPLAYYDIVINGLYLSQDSAYLKRYVTASLVGANANSNVGTYTILVDYYGIDNNYLPTITNGVYTITPASFNGITFSDRKYLFDNKKHSIQISYDEELWTDISVAYNIEDVTDIGVYNVTATVSKSNYATTVYSAKLTIATLNLTSSSQTDRVEITDLSVGSNGFSPDLTMLLKTSELGGINLAVKEKLKSLPTQQENIVAIYDITLLQDNVSVAMPIGSYRIKVAIPNVTTDSNIRILASVDNTLTEVEYTFENGYFIFETDSLYGIAILKTTQITESRIGTIVVVSIFVIIVLGMLYLLLGSFSGQGKAKLRSRKNHHKWS